MGCAALVVASGSSRRMGFDKLAADLAGAPVLRRSLDAFLACEAIERVVVVAPPERFAALLPGPFDKPVERVDGGTERRDSVARGLDALGPDDELVAVHDGARPLLRPGEVARCLEAAREFGAAALARPLAESLTRADADDFARERVDRERLWITETPQCFRTELLRAAYRRVLAEGLAVTDEVAALAADGHPTKLLASRFPNPKVTLPGDLELCRSLLDQ